MIKEFITVCIYHIKFSIIAFDPIKGSRNSNKAIVW